MRNSWVTTNYNNTSRKSLYVAVGWTQFGGRVYYIRLSLFALMAMGLTIWRLAS